MNLTYRKILTEYPQFRLLTAALATSLIGDWIGLLALFAILGSGQDSVAAEFSILIIIKQLPIVLFSVFGGFLADTFSKKKVMVISDIARGIITLMFLFTENHTLIYFLIFVQSFFSSLFEPSRASLIPGMVPKEDLATANGVSSFVWSTALIIGSSIGGILLEIFGVKAVLLLNALSFFLSCLIILKIKETHVAKRHDEKVPFREIFKEKKSLLIVTLIKPIYGLGAAMYLLLAILGKESFSTLSHPEAGISILYTARGAGALLGPVLFLRCVGAKKEIIPKIILLGFFMISLGYIGVGSSNSIIFASLCTILAHAGGSVLWVYSSTLLQSMCDQKTLGRVIGIEQMGFFTSSTLSQVLIGAIVGSQFLTASEATFVLSGIWIGCLVLFYILFQRVKLIE